MVDEVVGALDVGGYMVRIQTTDGTVMKKLIVKR